MLFVATLLAIGLVVAGNCLRLLRRDGTLAFANPAVLVSIFFLLIHVFTPLAKWQSGWYRYTNGYDQLTLTALSIFLFIAYEWSFLTIASHHRRGRKLDHGSRFSGWHSHKARIILFVGLVAFVTGLYGAQTNVPFQGTRLSDLLSGAATSSHLVDRIDSGVGRGIATQLPNFMIAASALFLQTYLQALRRFYKSMAGIMLAVSLSSISLYYLKINSRNSIFLTLAVLATLYCYQRPTRIRLSANLVRRTAGALILVFLSLGLFVKMTKSRYAAVDSAYVETRTKRLGLAMLDGAFGNNENLAWLATHDFQKHWGMTYLAAVTNFVPRDIWHTKPLGAGPRLKNAIAPGSYVVGAAGNSSITTGLFAEGMLNFGTIGVPLAAAIWTFTSNFWLSRRRQTHFSLTATLWTVVIVFWSSAILYQEFLGFLGRLVFLLAPLVAAAALERLVNRQRARQSRGRR